MLRCSNVSFGSKAGITAVQQQSPATRDPL
jgi:hypothetical protein